MPEINTYRLDECTSRNHDRVDFRFFEMSIVVNVRVAIAVAEKEDPISWLGPFIRLPDSVREIVPFLAVLFDESSTFRYVGPVRILGISLLSASSV